MQSIINVSLDMFLKNKIIVYAALSSKSENTYKFTLSGLIHRSISNFWKSVKRSSHGSGSSISLGWEDSYMLFHSLICKSERNHYVITD